MHQLNPRDQKASQVPTSEKPPENGIPYPLLELECQQLKERVNLLERELQQSRQALLDLQTETAPYRRTMYAWAREKFLRKGGPLSETEFDILLEKAVPLENLIEELERIAKGR